MDNLGAYEVPTYDEAFPPMASAPNEVPTRNGRTSPPNQWHSKMSVRSSTVTQVSYLFRVLHNFVCNSLLCINFLLLGF